MLDVGRRDLSRPNRIGIDRDPAPKDYVSVARSGAGPIADAIGAASQECWLYRIEGRVNAGIVTGLRRQRFGEFLLIVEVSRDRALFLGLRDTELDHLAMRVQNLERAAYLLRIGF